MGRVAKSRESKWLRIEQLDKSFERTKTVHVPVPRGGWIKEIRQALGMTAAQLARRLGITQPSLAGLETSEVEGSITLASLRKLADALGCELVYTVTPKTTLKEMVDQQIRQKVLQHVGQTAHTMALEAQSIATDRTEAQARALFAKMKFDPPKNLWE